MFGLTGSLVARGQQPAGFAGHRAARVRLDVGEVAESDLVFAGQGMRVERVELNGAIVSGLDVERTRRIREPVLAVVDLGQPREQTRGEGALFGRHGLARGHALDDDRAVLLLKGHVLAVEFARSREGERRTGEIARGSLRRHLVAQDGDLARGVSELAGAPQVLLRLLRLLQVVVPEVAEFFVHLGQLGANLRALRRDGPERLRSSLEQRHERLVVALLAIELCEPIGSDPLRGVAIDGLHQHTGRAMRVSECRGPHVRGFAQPVMRCSSHPHGISRRTPLCRRTSPG